MTTTLELLMNADKDELISMTIRLGLPPLREQESKERWAQHIARGLETHWENLLLMLDEEETRALVAALPGGGDIREDDMDDALMSAMLTLEPYGLVEADDDVWHVDPRLPGWMTLREEDMAQQHMQDALYAYMQGWLLHVGMMPMSELTRRAADLVEPETDEEREDLMHLCHALLIARGGMEGMIVDEYDEPWAVQAELEDPETLLERLRMPFLKKLPYPDFDPDALAIAGEHGRTMGRAKLYLPLLDFLEAHIVCDDEDEEELTAEDHLYNAVMMIQNEQVEEAVSMLTEAIGTQNMRLVEQLTDLVFELSNNIPRWYNKGYSPEEMIAHAPGKRGAMPGRNDPCPCGSGRKYKQCCGSRMN